VEREAEPNGIIPTASSTAALALGDALAIALMEQKGFSQQDFALFHPKGQLGKKLLKINDLMHKGGQVPVVGEHALISEVLTVMSGKRMGMTCIVDTQKKLVGILTDGDLRRLLQKHGSVLLNKTAGQCMTPDPLAIDRNDLATKALHIMENKKVTVLIVKNEQGGIEGIVHLHDLWRTEMF